MKILKKRWVAVTVMLLCIALAVGIGRLKSPAAQPGLLPAGLDESLDTAYCEQFIYDKADVLSTAAEKKLALYNANWNARYNSLTAFVSVDNVSVSAEEYAWEMASSFGLKQGDALLLVVKDADLYRLVWGADFDSIMNAKATDTLAACMDGGKWEEDTLNFYAALNGILVSNFGEGNGAGQDSAYYGAGSGSAVLMLLILFVIVLLLLSAVERSRYNTYRRQYYGVPSPPVTFRPIFFWHGPGSSWYRRGWRPPPPPPPAGPRGPGSFGGARAGGSSRPAGTGGGFGGAGARSPRGSGFSGGGSFGGARGGGSFGGSRGGGSFGGARGGGSFGGARGGSSFGGSRGGGSFGGARGGGSFGGSRGGGSRGGGSFGGRR